MTAAPTGQNGQEVASVVTPSRVRQRAFTLVELLVVIGIIALLISILLPVLSRAREQARNIKCQNNIRSILQAMFMYANDNGGTLPIPVPSIEGSGSAFRPFAAVQMSGLYMYDYSTGTLMPYVGPSPQIREALFTCPADGPERYGVLSGPTSYPLPLDPTQPRNFSYQFNSHLMGRSINLGALWSGIKLSQVVHANFKILVIEEDHPYSRPEDQPVVVGDVLGRPTFVTLTRRHQGKANEGFADGHVEGLDGRATFGDLGTAGGQTSAAKYVSLTSDQPGAYP